MSKKAKFQGVVTNTHQSVILKSGSPSSSLLAWLEMQCVKIREFFRANFHYIGIDCMEAI